VAIEMSAKLIISWNHIHGRLRGSRTSG